MKQRLIPQRRLSAALAILVSTQAALSLVVADSSAHPADTPRFLLSTFRNADQTKLYIAESYDGRYYEPRGGEHVHEVSGSDRIRDPSLTRYNGRWYVCHTAGVFGNVDYFRVMSSADLQTWTHEKNVSMSAISGTLYTWAPEWFIDRDGSLHVLVSVTGSPAMSYEHVLYETHPLDPDDLSGEWSSPVRLHGGAFPEFEPSPDGVQRVGAIDAYVVIKDGTYYMVFSNRPTSSMALASSPSLIGPWTMLVDGQLWGTGVYKEGHCLIHLGGAIWRLSFADAIASKLYYIESRDDWATWTEPALLGSPDGLVFNHGTVIHNPEASRFAAGIVERGGAGTLTARVPTFKQNWYQWETSATLAADSWLPAGDPIEGDGTPLDREFSLPADNDNLFLRARWLPFGP